MSNQSICNRCSNKPCRDNESITPDSGYPISMQFKIEFDFGYDGMFISKCSGFNKKDYYYIKIDKRCFPQEEK
jgi:hypothetical protein